MLPGELQALERLQERQLIPSERDQIALERKGEIKRSDTERQVVEITRLGHAYRETHHTLVWTQNLESSRVPELPEGIFELCDAR